MTDDSMRQAAEGWDASEVARILSAIPTANGLLADGIAWSRGKLFEYAINRALGDVAEDRAWPWTKYEDLVVGGRIEKTAVEQIDGGFLLLGRWWIVECKDEKGPIDDVPLHRMRGLVQQRPSGTMGLVVSRNGFTAPALASSIRHNPLNLLLANGAEIAGLNARNKLAEGLALKLRQASLEGDPAYDSLLVP